MEENVENNTWHDKKIKLNNEMVLHSVQLSINTETQACYRDALEKKLEALKIKFRESEQSRLNKQQQLKYKSKLISAYRNSIRNTNESRSSMRSYLYSLKNLYKKENENDNKKHIIADSVKAHEELSIIYEHLPLQKQRTELKNKIIEKKQQLSVLQNKIDEEKHRQKLRRLQDWQEEQKNIIKFAELMIDYRSMEATSVKLQEDTEKQKSASKSDNIIISEGVKEIDSSMNANSLKLSPLKVINIDANSNNDFEISHSLTRGVSRKRRQPQESNVQNKKVCLPTIYYVALSEQNLTKQDTLQPCEKLCALDTCDNTSNLNVAEYVKLNNYNIAQKPTPAKIVDTNKQNMHSIPQVNHMNGQIAAKLSEGTKASNCTSNPIIKPKSHIVGSPVSLKINEEKITESSSIVPVTAQQNLLTSTDIINDEQSQLTNESVPQPMDYDCKQQHNLEANFDEVTNVETKNDCDYIDLRDGDMLPGSDNISSKNASFILDLPESESRPESPQDKILT